MLYLEHKEMPCGALDALYGRDDNELGLASQGKSRGNLLLCRFFNISNNMLLCTGIISFDLVKIDFHVNCHQLHESPFILDQNSGINA